MLLCQGAVVLCSLSVQPNSPIKSIEELLQIASDHAPYFDQAHLAYDFQLEKAGSDVKLSSVVLSTDCTFWRKSDKYRRDLVQKGESDTGVPKLLKYGAIYDAQHLHTLNHSAKSYVVRTTDSPEKVATLGDAFLDFHLRNTGLEENAGGLTGQSILSLLSTPSIIVRSELEMIENRACHVIDIPAKGGLLQGSVWLDAERGCLPMRQDFLGAIDATGNQEVFLRFEVTKVYDASGSWMIQEGLKIVDPATTKEKQYRYVLDLAMVEPTMGKPIDDAVFVPDVPSGYLCKDIALDKSWVQP